MDSGKRGHLASQDKQTSPAGVKILRALKAPAGHLLVHFPFLIILTFCFCFSAKTAAADDWPVKFQHKHFRVYSQVSTEKLLPQVEALPELQKRIGDVLGLTVYDETIHLVIFSSHSQYKAYIRPRIPDAVSRKALFVRSQDRLTVYVVYYSGWQTDLRHEVTHATLHGCLPYVPIWLDEGLAEYFEVPDSFEGRNDPLLKNLMWRLRFRRKLRSDELENIQELSEMRPEHYRDSWGWVYFCLHESDQSRAILQKYLMEIQDEKVVGSFSKRLNESIPDLHRRVSRFYLD